MVKTLRAFLLVAALAAPAPAQELIGGYEGDAEGGYGFGSLVLETARERPRGLVLRLTGSHLRYRYPEAAGDTEVTAPGAALGVGLRLRGAQTTFTVGPGVEVRRKTTGFAAGPRREETLWGAVVSAELYSMPSPTSALFAFGSWNGADDYLWGRAGGKLQVSNRSFAGSSSWLVGAQVTAHGNDEVDVVQVGPLLELSLKDGGSFQLHGGWSRRSYPSAPSRDQGYFGISYYRRF